MNYIGSKHTLREFIVSNILSVVGDDIGNLVFCDLFAGTGAIGRAFKPIVKKVIANDLEYYSFVLNRNYIGNNERMKYKNVYVDLLNNIPLSEGFICKHYCLSGKAKRQYFTNDNGMRIDSYRRYVETLRQEKKINDDLYYFLLASLLESADKVANTTSVYGAYLKKFKKSALTKMIVAPAEFQITDTKHQVFNMDSNDLIKQISGDVLYLDPPYNARQYGSNYHLLNTIALSDDFIPAGKTGLRPYNKSLFCRKTTAKDYLEELIKNSEFKFVFLSYNNEGLIKYSDIEDIMSKYGEYKQFNKTYQRFRADKKDKRNYTANKTIEYLHVLIK